MENIQKLKQKVYDILNNNRCNDDNKDKPLIYHMVNFGENLFLKKNNVKN